MGRHAYLCTTGLEEKGMWGPAQWCYMENLCVPTVYRRFSFLKRNSPFLL